MSGRCRDIRGMAVLRIFAVTCPRRVNTDPTKTDFTTEKVHYCANCSGNFEGGINKIWCTSPPKDDLYNIATAILNQVPSIIFYCRNSYPIPASLIFFSFALLSAQSLAASNPLLSQEYLQLLAAGAIDSSSNPLLSRMSATFDRHLVSRPSLTFSRSLVLTCR